MCDYNPLFTLSASMHHQKIFSDDGKEFLRLAHPLSAVAFNYRFNKALLAILAINLPIVPKQRKSC